MSGTRRVRLLFTSSEEAASSLPAVHRPPPPLVARLSSSLPTLVSKLPLLIPRLNLLDRLDPLQLHGLKGRDVLLPAVLLNRLLLEGEVHRALDAAVALEDRVDGRVRERLLHGRVLDQAVLVLETVLVEGRGDLRPVALGDYGAGGREVVGVGRGGKESDGIDVLDKGF